jgi:hypothetical protein
MGGKFNSQLWFNAIRNYTLHDYCEMTSNNEGQSCEALPSLLHSVENCFASSSPSSSYSLETEDEFLVSLVFLFSSFLNEVTEDGFSSPVFLMFVRSLGVQRLGSLTSYRTVAGSGVWGRRPFRAWRRLHLSFVVAVHIIQSFCCFPLL